MANQNGETRGARRSRDPVVSAVAADTPDIIEPILRRQALWLARRLCITPDRARLLASLAFDGRRG